MLRRVGQSFGAQIFGLALGFFDRFIVVGVLLRTLGSPAYADWAVLLASAGLLSLAEGGLNIYFGNVWQRTFATGDRGGFQRMLSVSLGCAAILGAALLVVAVVIAARVDLPAALELRSLSGGQAALIFLLLAAAIVSRVTRGAVSQLYRGRGVFALGTVIDQLSSVALIAATLTATLVFGGGLLALAIVYLATDLIAGWGITLFDLRRRFPDLAFRPTLPARAEVVEIFRHVRWFAVPQVGPIALLQVPVLIASASAVGATQIVSFVVLRTLINFARQLASMLSNAVGVELATVIHAGSPADVAARLAVFGRFLSAIAASIVVAVLAFGAPFVGLWTGSAKHFDPVVVGWLLPGMLVSIIAAPLASVALLSNRPKPVALAYLVQLAVGLGAMVVLIPRYGIGGAAAGLAAGDMLAFGVVMPLMITPVLGIDYRRYLAGCLTGMMLSATIAGVAAWAVTRFFALGSVLSLGTAGVLWAAIGFAPAVFAALPRERRRQVVDLVRTLPARVSAARGGW